MLVVMGDFHLKKSPRSTWLHCIMSDEFSMTSSSPDCLFIQIFVWMCTLNATLAVMFVFRFAFGEDTPEFKHKVAFLQKLTIDQLKIMKKILGLQSGGNTKDALVRKRHSFSTASVTANVLSQVTTIMVFMMKTVDHERKVPGKKRKSTAKTPSTAKRSRKSKGSDEVGLIVVEHALICCCFCNRL